MVDGGTFDAQKAYKDPRVGFNNVGSRSCGRPSPIGPLNANYVYIKMGLDA